VVVFDGAAAVAGCGQNGVGLGVGNVRHDAPLKFVTDIFD
jgi:hypothetical protein